MSISDHIIVILAWILAEMLRPFPPDLMWLPLLIWGLLIVLGIWGILALLGRFLFPRR